MMRTDETETTATRPAIDEVRRRLMRRCCEGAVVMAGLPILSGCKDDVVGAEAVPSPPVAVASQAPAYTASDTDRLNYALQLHYLLAVYLQRGVYGTTLASSLTSGSGAVGAVRGGTRVTFSTATLTAQMREVADSAVAHLSLLRRLAGADVTAQPAIDIRGGEGSPFQAVAQVPNATPAPSTPAVPFDPFASEAGFLQGAVALSAVVSSAMVDLPRRLSGSLPSQVIAMVSAGGARDGVLRAALYNAAFAEDLLPEEERGKPTLYSRSEDQSGARDRYDGDRDLDRGIGSSGYPDVLADDPDHNALRRTPEQALGILYASAASVSSGAFFPAGVNGMIRTSGANALSE